MKRLVYLELRFFLEGVAADCETPLESCKVEVCGLEGQVRISRYWPFQMHAG